MEVLNGFSEEDTWRRQNTLPTAFSVCVPQVSTAWIQTRTSWTCTTATAVGSGSSSWGPTPAGGCEGWTDVLWFGSLQMDKSEPAKREQTPRSPLFLSHSPSERRGTRRQMGEADPWRFCQEQSLKTVHDHINMHRPPLPSPFSSTHHSIIPLLRSHSAAVLRAKKKKPLTVTHYFQQRTWRIENRGEGVDPISSSERADGDAEHLWLQGPHSALKPASMFPVVGFVHPSPVQMWNIFLRNCPPIF